MIHSTTNYGASPLIVLYKKKSDTLISLYQTYAFNMCHYYEMFHIGLSHYKMFHDANFSSNIKITNNTKKFLT